MYPIQKPWLLGAVVFLALACGPLAAQTTFTMLGYPEGVEGPVMGGVYTSPYYATIGSNPNPVPVVCDDFADETYFSESWTAIATLLSSVPTTTPPLYYSGGTVWGVGVVDQAEAYTIAAYLAVEILETNQSSPSSSEPGVSGAEAAGDLSYALWALFDPAVFLDQTGGTCTLPNGIGCLSTSNPNDLGMAEQDLTNAYNAVNNILTPTNFDSMMGVQSVTIYSSTIVGGGAAAEFIAVSMVEPSSPLFSVWIFWVSQG